MKRYNPCLSTAAQRDLRKLRRIKQYEEITGMIRNDLAEDPYKAGIKLKYLPKHLKGLRRATVGKYRILYTVEDYEVYVQVIDHRKKVYERTKSL